MNIICQDLRTMGNSLSKDLGLCEPALKLQTETPLFLEHDAASKVRDVLVHMVRNSLYHGFMGMKLDHPEIEIQSQVGTRWILAYRDNGKGLNCRKLRELGQKRGIAGVDSWSPQQLVELIIEEGVSTAEKVNDISGRGTGMGAVRAMIEELGGRLLPEVAAENPQGYAPLVFRLDFPRSWLVDEETPSGTLLPASA